MITWLEHGKIRLALHELRPASGSPATANHSGNGPEAHPLLVLHGLGQASPATPPEYSADWPGSVFALDFTGHGASTVPVGGGYTSEILMADADTALDAIGAATVVGCGLGAYIALLTAGGRPSQVRGVALCDGPGLFGGSPGPVSAVIRTPDPGKTSPPDPFALSELAGDIRPPDYAVTYAHQALGSSGIENPVAICARSRPDWLSAVVSEPGVIETDLDTALKSFATQA